LGVDRLAKKQIHGGDLALVPLVILTKKQKFNRKQKKQTFKKL